MSTVTKAATMVDPNDLSSIGLGTIGTAVGGLGVAGMAVLKIWKMFSADRADAANSAAEIQMLREYQTENKELRARLDTKDQQIATLMQQKFNFESDLKIATDKIERMTAEMVDMRAEMSSLRDAIKGARNEQRTE